MKQAAGSDERDFDGQGAIIQSLTQQGFLKAHVKEALQYTVSKCVVVRGSRRRPSPIHRPRFSLARKPRRPEPRATLGLPPPLIRICRPGPTNLLKRVCAPRPEALDWLCLHVPEGDLPEKYRPNHPEVAAASQTPVRPFVLGPAPAAAAAQRHTFPPPLPHVPPTPPPACRLLHRTLQETLARLYKARRLAGFGFSEIESLRLLATVDDDEYSALDVLIEELLPEDCPEKPEYAAFTAQARGSRHSFVPPTVPVPCAPQDRGRRPG